MRKDSIIRYFAACGGRNFGKNQRSDFITGSPRLNIDYGIVNVIPFWRAIHHGVVYTL